MTEKCSLDPLNDSEIISFNYFAKLEGELSKNKRSSRHIENQSRLAEDMELSIE